ncbi:MAG TPA: hypothetical protein VF640_10000 [Acidimicrobiales bacterium]
MSGARRRLLALAVLVVLAASACHTDVRVRVDVEDDGSGAVSVAVGLDAEALSRIPDLADQLRVDDLARAGWTVTGPAEEEDGRTWVRATKPFADPDEMADVMAEVAGTNGPFLDFSASVDRSLARSKVEARGTVDLSGGLEAFADPQVTQRLGGLPFGQDLAGLLGDTPPADAVTVTVALALPGDLSPVGATREEPGVAVWEVPLGGQPVDVAATSSQVRMATVVWLGVAALAVLGLVGVVGIRALTSFRYRYW